MKTHLIFIGAVSLLGTSLLATSYAANTSEYLHLTRHRDSNGNLLMGATQHQAESSVMQKTVMPSQPKTFERRSTDWGMSVQEVKDNEPIQSTWELQSPVLADFERRVAYHTQIEGIEAGLTYTFYQDHLGQAKYVFEPQHEDTAEFVNDFDTVKNWISQSYGEPTSSQEIWLDKLYQYDKSLWGQAIKRGHLVMVAEWENPGTNIVLVLDGGDDTAGLVADFASTTFVVPVSLDTQSSEQNVQEAFDESTIQETLPAEPMTDSSEENIPMQDLSSEIGGSGDFHSETEVASQGPEDDIEELKEIEEMLNEGYPVTESVEPAIEGNLMDTQVNEAMMESAADVQAPVSESTLDAEGMPLEPSSIEEPAMEAPLSDEHAAEHGLGESANEHVMEAESELAPQHL